MARAFYRAAHANDSIPEFGRGFPLDRDLAGSHRSRSSNSLITDSAAGATAFSCGVKSYNGAIGVDQWGKPCGTIFEAAKAKDYLTGVVVTSRLTDATPASFFAHAASRSEESVIASQMLEAPYDGGQRTIDLAVGGGGCYFLPKSHPLSCREDDLDLVSRAEKAGWNVRLGPAMQSDSTVAAAFRGPHGEQLRLSNTSQVEGHGERAPKESARLPYLSLISPFNTPYVLDTLETASGRVGAYSLAETSKGAIRALADGAISHEVRRRKHGRSTDSGFLIMIEGSQIDLCQHQNDPACMVREAIAFQEAAAEVKKEVDALNAQGRRTLLIATSDHETGGLTLGRQIGPDYPEYAYYPERLLNARASAQTLSARLMDHLSSSPSDEATREFIATNVLGPLGGLGLGPASTGGDITDEEVQEVVNCIDVQRGQFAPPIDNGDHCRSAIADVASRRAQVGWSTPGHTGVDIPVYAYGHEALGLRGNIENTDIGGYVAELLGLDLPRISRKLQ
ncbi:unnamed protein product [Parajaminaea phylloscopi]